MDQAKLIKAREYYDRVAQGEDKTSVALELYGKKGVASIENSQEYLAIVSAASLVQKQELRKEIEQTKRRQLRSYNKLLDKGEELMDEAKTVQDKIAAQANQRANLSSGIVDSAIAWDGEDRNANDLGDILEGVIV